MQLHTRKGVGDMGDVTVRASNARFPSLGGPTVIDYIRVTFTDITPGGTADSSATLAIRLDNINEPWKRRLLLQMTETGITGTTKTGINWQWENANPEGAAYQFDVGEELVFERTADDADNTQWLIEVGLSIVENPRN